MTFFRHFIPIFFFACATLGILIPLKATSQPPPEAYAPTQRQDVALSPRTTLGRKNLQYEYDLHPANVFRHLEAVEKHEKKFKLKRRIDLFRDTTIFEDDI